MNMEKSVSARRPKVKTVPSGPDPARLLAWYDRHRRILPWRALPDAVADPYKVWLSEIMLQQTTVATVGPYFQRFVKKWPTLKHLAKAPLDDILTMWAGLGYYRRARMLHECAQHILKNLGGVFPDNEATLLELPGFGPYTAAAVAAIAFGLRANVVDGNVERVIARIFAIGEPLPKSKPKLKAAALTLLPAGRFGDYAQALMDLGATICTPRHPKCDLCPWMEACRAKALGIAEELPRKAKAAAKPVKHAIAFVLFNDKGEIFFRRRPPQGLLGGMMEVPSSDWLEGPTPKLKTVGAQAPAKAAWQSLPGSVRHVFSHFELQITVVLATTHRPPKGKWAGPDKLDTIALPTVMRKIVRYALETRILPGISAPASDR